TSPSRLLDLGLLGLAIAVVAMVVGYLVGPMIERRISPEASQRSSVQAAEASSTIAGQSATDRSSSDQRSSDRGSTSQGARTKSLPDLPKLAGRGVADAQCQMGVRYHNGEGVLRADVQAVQCFLRAADLRHVTAQATLGAY